MIPAPRRLGPFVLGERLALGGSSEVFRAKDERGEPVALKRLLPTALEVPGAREALREEARLLDLLAGGRFPRALGVVEVGPRGDEPILVLEPLPGCTLARLLRDVAPGEAAASPEAVAAVGCQVAGALAALHALPGGWVHRDVAPPNLQVEPSGRVLLLDLGLAVTRERSGRPGYASPEARAGRAPGPASDLFSLGVVLSELATGRRYDASAPAAIRDDLANALAPCLEPDPARRLSSASRLRDDLAALLPRGPAGAPEPIVARWIESRLGPSGIDEKFRGPEDA